MATLHAIRPERRRPVQVFPDDEARGFNWPLTCAALMGISFWAGVIVALIRIHAVIAFLRQWGIL